MQVNFNFLVACALFIAFSIGFNLGMHGIMLFSEGKSAAVSTSEVHMTVSKSVDKPNENQLKNEIFGYPTQTPVQKTSDIQRLVQDSESKDNTASIHSKISSIHKSLADKAITPKEGVLSSFINSGGKFPIVLLTNNRASLLESTIASILSVRGVSKDQLIISQDGALKEISDIAKNNQLALVQNLEGVRLRGGAAVDGAERIARHYKFSLSAAFDKSPRAPAILIIEDDLLFSPDFYEYFIAVAPILDEDPTTFIISAWSDNGFKDKIAEPFALRRTDYFPGLGWLLTRKLYKGDLEAKWPTSHWDHWLRSPEIHRYREIVYPQVPRSFHNGIKGTFMNMDTHNRYFRDIGYNTDAALRWDDTSTTLLHGIAEYPAPVYSQAQSSLYEERVKRLIQACKHLNSPAELLHYQDEILCMWIRVNPTSERSPPEFDPIARFFGIWHEHRRGSHRGLHEFHWNGNYVLLLNTYDTTHGRKKDLALPLIPYSELRPRDSNTIEPSAFDPSILIDIKRARIKINVVKGAEVDRSCDQICASAGKECVEERLQLLNSCSVMSQHFNCRSCGQSTGEEQPAYVSPSASQQFEPGNCLVNSRPEYSKCGARHHATIRLCACSD